MRYRDCRRAGRSATHGYPLPDAPKHELGLRVVVTRDPRRASAGFPVVAAPGVAPRLSGPRSHVGFPHLFSCFGIVRSDEAAIRSITTRNAGDELAIGHKRRRRHILARACCRQSSCARFPCPSLASSATSIGFPGEEHFVAVKRHTAIDRLASHVAGRWRCDSATGRFRSSRRWRSPG